MNNCGSQKSVENRTRRGSAARRRQRRREQNQQLQGFEFSPLRVAMLDSSQSSIIERINFILIVSLIASLLQISSDSVQWYVSFEKESSPRALSMVGWHKRLSKFGYPRHLTSLQCIQLHYNAHYYDQLTYYISFGDLKERHDSAQWILK